MGNGWLLFLGLQLKLTSYIRAASYMKQLFFYLPYYTNNKKNKAFHSPKSKENNSRQSTY